MVHLTFDPRWTDDNLALPLSPYWPFGVSGVSHMAAAGKVTQMAVGGIRVGMGDRQRLWCDDPL